MTKTLKVYSVNDSSWAAWLDRRSVCIFSHFFPAIFNNRCDQGLGLKSISQSFITWTRGQKWSHVASKLSNDLFRINKEQITQYPDMSHNTAERGMKCILWRRTIPAPELSVAFILFGMELSNYRKVGFLCAAEIWFHSSELWQGSWKGNYCCYFIRNITAD